MQQLQAHFYENPTTAFHRILPIPTYSYLLPTSYLPLTYHSLATHLPLTYHSLTTHLPLTHLLPATSHLPLTYHSLTSHISPLTSWLSCLGSYFLPPTSHIVPLTSYLLAPCSQLLPLYLFTSLLLYLLTSLPPTSSPPNLLTPYLLTLRNCASATSPFLRKSPNTVSIHPMVLKPLLFQYCFAD